MLSDLDSSAKLLVLGLFIISPPLTSNCHGQYEHFRNRESVFKEYRPYFEHEGRNMSAVTGQSVHLPCGVRNLGDRYVSWLRGSDLQVLSSGWNKFTGDNRIRIIPADQSHAWTLAITNVTTKDSGPYFCQVNTEPKLTLTFNLKVEDSTAAIPGNHERGVQAGSELKLQCRILKIVQPHETPPSAMRWLHNGDALPTNDDRITLSSAWNPKEITLVSTLAISPVNLEDTGLYTCQSGFNSEANVTVIVISGEQRAAIQEENSSPSTLLQQRSPLSLPSVTWLVVLLLCDTLSNIK